MVETRLRDLREDRDLTQRELAEYLGVHQTCLLYTSRCV